MVFSYFPIAVMNTMENIILKTTQFVSQFKGITHKRKEVQVSGA